MKDFSKEMRAYALKNALEHEGKAVSGAVINGLFNHGLKKEGVKKIISDILKTLKEINSLSLEEQKKQFDKVEGLIGHRREREGLPELKNVDKKRGIVTRFAPSPSGPLHVGHVLSAMPSSLYVKKYGGKFYVRIEDTNPENIYEKAYKMIRSECEWLFDNVEEYIIQSDRLKIYYKYAEKLIGLGAGYVCDCDNERFKKMIEEQKECSCRKLGRKENLFRWKKMLDAKGYKEEEVALRFRGNIKDSNPAFRDFPLARINLAEHPRQGKKFRVWPLMNLSVAVDDIEFKTTHAIRGKDHRDNSVRQKMIYSVLKKKFPENLFIGRINFDDFELSTTKTRKAIESGVYSGWDDSKLPFVASLKKRGYKKEAFEFMAIQRGISEVDKVIPQKDFYELLDRCNNQSRVALHEN